MDSEQQVSILSPELKAVEEALLPNGPDSEEDAEQSSGDESEMDEVNPRDQQIQLARDFSPINKIPFVFVFDNKKSGMRGSLRYTDLTIDAKDNDIFPMVFEINKKLLHMLLDDNALKKVLLVAPEFRNDAFDLVADKPGTLRTLHLPAEAMDGFNREQQRSFADWLNTIVAPSVTKLHLFQGEERKAKIHEDAKYALCMLVDREDDYFCRYLSARPEMIDELSKFEEGNGIFTWYIITRIAPLISENYLSDPAIYHDSCNLRRLSQSTYLWLREEFGKKPMDKGQRNIAFNRKVKLVLSSAASSINSALTKSDKFKVFGIIHGSIQGGALQHMGRIQQKAKMRNKMIGKSIANLITAALLIPGLFCAHFGGILLSLGAALIQPWLEEGFKKVANKVMPVTKWFTFMCRVVVDQLDDLESSVKELYANNPEAGVGDMENFVYYAKLGLKKGLPDHKFEL